METVGLIISDIISIILLIYISKIENKTQLQKDFFITIILMTFWDTIALVQKLCYVKYNINPLYFDYFTYIGICFLPISLLYVSRTFINTKIKHSKFEYLLFTIPITSLIILWTNKYHYLFYKYYSMNYSEIIFGDYVNYIHNPYSYFILLLSIFNMIKYSIKNLGLFSKQLMLFCVGAIIPISINILATLNIFSMTIYATPISFSITILCLAFAIFKFKFLSVTPIAMRKIVDRMSDSFIVINEEYRVIDFNETFAKTFRLSKENIRNMDFVEFIIPKKIPGITLEYIKNTINKSKKSKEVIPVKKEMKIKDKYFNVEATGIFSKNNFLGTLVLLKNVTQHVLDMETIENNQSVLIEKERLASLGQMIGGIAHNLKTPIMSISGAAEGLRDLAKEYDISIGDPTVTNEDHHAIVKDMEEWINKIKTHTAYMSDIITAVKGQAVAFSNNDVDSFTISELLMRVDVLMKHELKHALIELKVTNLVPSDFAIKGNVNSLVQVINNIISNAIQAYNGQTNKNIDLIIKITGNDVVISIQDYACGMSKAVQDKLFKEMITTKGKNGTGLGLFMSYSNIKAHFNGDMSFISKEGEGTKFIIVIPKG